MGPRSLLFRAPSLTLTRISCFANFNSLFVSDQRRSFSGHNHNFEKTNVIFTSNVDSYGGRIINHEEVVSCPSQQIFEKKLHYTMDIWRKEGDVKGVWLEIPVEHSNLLPSALNNGFEIHHAHKESITLTYWFPGEKGIANSLPMYNSHTVGVGAAIMNQNRELLVVQERTGPASKLKDFWKFPTGIVHSGEDSYEACEREVFEETGVHVTAENLVSVREAHYKPKNDIGSGISSISSTFQTNIFFVFTCKPKLNERDQIDIIRQDHEISKCRWMNANEFLNSQDKIMPPGSVYNVINRKAVQAANNMWDFTEKEEEVPLKSTKKLDEGVGLRGFRHNDFPFRRGVNRLYYPVD